MAMAFAELLNEEARALEADGVDVIQFDEPAFNVYMDEVQDWGIEALHRAIEGLTCTTAVHICYGYGIKANIDWKATLGGEWRQYEEIFPALADEPHRPGLGRVHATRACRSSCWRCSRARTCWSASIDVASDEVETPEQVAAVIERGDEVRAEGADRRLHQLRHGADARGHRASPSWHALGARAPDAGDGKQIRVERRRYRLARGRARPSVPLTLAPLLALVAAGDRVLDAMADVVAQDLLLDPPQRGAHRRNLRDDVDAVAVLLDHARRARAPGPRSGCSRFST